MSQCSSGRLKNAGNVHLGSNNHAVQICVCPNLLSCLKILLKSSDASKTLSDVVMNYIRLKKKKGKLKKKSSLEGGL